jgi:hypothetical protein
LPWIEIKKKMFKHPYMKSISEFMGLLIARCKEHVRGIILAIVAAEVRISAEEKESRK